MTQTPSFSPPAGWYPDTNAPGTQRWWTGAEWTDHVQPTPLEAVQQPAGPSSYRPFQMAVTSLVFGGIALALNPFFLASIVGWARGAQGLKRAKLSVHEGYGPRGRSLSVWGIVLSSLGVPMGVLQTWTFVDAWASIL